MISPHMETTSDKGRMPRLSDERQRRIAPPQLFDMCGARHHDIDYNLTKPVTKGACQGLAMRGNGIRASAIV